MKKREAIDRIQKEITELFGLSQKFEIESQKVIHQFILELKQFEEQMNEIIKIEEQELEEKLEKEFKTIFRQIKELKNNLQEDIALS